LHSGDGGAKCGKVDRFVSRGMVYKELSGHRFPDDDLEMVNHADNKQTLLEFGIVAPADVARMFATDKRWYQDAMMRRFVLMFFLTGGYFVVELVVGLAIGSLALLSDAFHMLSDLMGLVVGFWAVRLSRSSKGLNTFHFGRAEVVGALVNSTFLVSVCFTLSLEAIERLFEAGEESKLDNNGVTLLIVATIGLLMNIIGMVIFGSHGHSHSHGGHGHSHGPSEEDALVAEEVRVRLLRNDDHGHGHGHGDHGHGHGHGKKSPTRNLNMHGVFLHIMGDALGSVAAITSGLVIWLSSSEYRALADPICTLVIACIILSSAFPLIRQTLHIALDSVPESVNMDRLNAELTKLPGVETIHDLHVWSISPNRILGSLHVVLKDTTDANIVLVQMKMICHKFGVHSTTIQPEFVGQQFKITEGQCIEPLCRSDACLNAFCCVPTDSSTEPIVTLPGVPPAETNPPV
jgi:zinc transporter 1